MSVDGMFQLDAAYGFSDIWALFIADTEVTLRYSTNVTGDKYYQCDAILTSLDADFPDNEASTWSATFQASGTPQEVTLT